MRPTSSEPAYRETMLDVAALSVSYGPVRAVRDVSFRVEAGTICVVLGANGAGKSSIIRAVMGLAKSHADRIDFNGVTILGKRPHVINRAGIAWVPEGRLIFPSLTVAENLRVGGFRWRDSRQMSNRVGATYDLFPRLEERSNQTAGSLSGGEQQMLALGRALMSDPQLLLLDEPSLGLAPLVVARVFDSLALIKERGISVLMAEQNAHEALRVADYAYVMENGVMTAQGSVTELASRPDIQAAYLGV